MAGKQPNTDVVPIVTLRTMLGAGSPKTTALEAHADPMTTAKKRYEKVLQRIEEETAKSGPNVLITVQDRDASVIQSRMAEEAKVGATLPAGGVEAVFGTGPSGGDILGWALSWFDHIDETEWHPIVRPPDGKTEKLADIGRVALLSDWGTNLYGAPKSAGSIKKAGGYELLMHLGDIYYSGTKKETKNRFIDVWPALHAKGAAKVSRALNGNHEMYSGGYAYIDDILPKFEQRSSYFAMQNANWLLLGLDTAHTDHAVDGKQADWVKTIVQNTGLSACISRMERRSSADGSPNGRAGSRAVAVGRSIGTALCC